MKRALMNWKLIFACNFIIVICMSRFIYVYFIEQDQTCNVNLTTDHLKKRDFDQILKLYRECKRKRGTVHYQFVDVLQNIGEIHFK
jgi:hypothetical protein